MALEIIIDKSRQHMQVWYGNNDPLVWLVSTGNRTHETPSGEFKPFRMEESHFSIEFDSAPMPHSIFFTKRGHAIHGTFEVRNLGKPVSHGCVRVHTINANLLFKMVKDIGLNNTTITILENNEPQQPQFQLQPSYRYYR